MKGKRSANEMRASAARALWSDPQHREKKVSSIKSAWDQHKASDQQMGFWKLRHKPESKQKISEGMKRVWAERKAEQAKRNDSLKQKICDAIASLDKAINFFKVHQIQEF